MNEQIDALYNRIGQALADLVGDACRKTFVRVEMADDFGSLGVFADGGDGTYRYLTDNSDTLFDLFAELRTLSRAEGMGAWSQATFEMAGGGRFSMEYGFDDVSDLGQGIARRDAWMKKYLGPDARVKWS